MKKKAGLGGARKGAGRKPLPEDALPTRVKKSVELRKEEVETIASLASSAGVTVHAWIVAAIRRAISDARPKQK